MEEKVLTIAVTNVLKAVAQLGNRLEECKGKEAVLNPDSLTLPKTSKQEILIALLYLRSQAAKRCQGDLWAKLSYALGDYNNVITHYDLKDRIEFEYEEFINMHAWRDFKLQVQYDALKPEIRKAFESNPQLLAPFASIKLFKEIEKGMPKGTVQ